MTTRQIAIEFRRIVRTPVWFLWCAVAIAVALVLYVIAAYMETPYAGTLTGRIYGIAASLLMLGLPIWRLYRPHARADAQACPVGTGRWSRVILWSASALWVLAVVIQVAADRYWLSGIG